MICMTLQSTINSIFRVYAVCSDSDGSATTTPGVECITNEVSGNQNLQSCANMLAGQTRDNFDMEVFCGISCIEDLRTLYDTCGFSPNPVEAREFVLADVSYLFK